MILRRRKAPKMGVREDTGRIHCPSHGKWIRGHCCAAQGKGKFPCEGRIEAHHSKTRGAWGGDDTLVPLCSFHHALLDSPNWSQRRFEQEHGLDFARLSADLWFHSPHGKKYRLDDLRRKLMFSANNPQNPDGGKAA